MRLKGPGSLSRHTLLACLLVGGLLPLAAASGEKAKAKETDSQEAQASR